jgi:ribosomal protein S18 acetylase RimI-like enzyme
MMPTHYRIRTAAAADLEALIALRRYAESWLHGAGIEQWTDHARGAAAIKAGITASTTHVVLDDDGNTIASLTLNGPDPDFWTSDDDPDTALYLYKFMIGPSGRGTGLGEAMLDWASGQAQARGKAWLRLDCWRTNITLQNYYARRGFQLLRIIQAPGRNSGALMQRPSDRRTADGRIIMSQSTPRASRATHFADHG